ncbi:response regulator [Bacillus sp. es.034]|uniref:response regulator transcription factor n=1 Tax=Bacillus sp. es.034 TaxID=1761763 RepID=UPI000C01CCA7|nr:response regulator [Bacillus sp. es.034]PFG07725.1 two-component system response regulator YesN [Bacillus sp. es.034]
MLKVILVDDEIQIRRGLKWKVDWEEEGFVIAGEASNGKEALQVIEEVMPDLVLTDVRMPVLDGMQLVKALSGKYPEIKVIVLSGYADFEYVRSSLVEGVKDYLLKPVDPEELTAALRKSKGEIEAEKQRRVESDRMNQFHAEEMREQYLLHLVKDEWAEKNISRERLSQLKLDVLVGEDAVVHFITVEIRSSDSEQVRDLFLPFKMLCRELSYEHEGIMSFYDASYPNMIHFLCHHHSGGDQVPHFVKELQKNVSAYLNLETVIGLGKVVRGLSQLKNGYISALLSWSQSSADVMSQLIDGTSSKQTAEFTEDAEWKLSNSMEQGDFESFKKHLLTTLAECDRQSVMSYSFAASRVLFMLGSMARKYDLYTDDLKKKMWNCQLGIWELTSRDRVKGELLDLARVIAEKVSETRHSSNGIAIVENVRRYMDRHYTNEISLTSLADQFHINSAYLSEMFKELVGQNFSDYLVNLRMEKARSLLMDEQLKVIEIAHLVGYSNSGYFSTVFKKRFGQKPLDYRKSMTEDKGEAR